MATEKKEMELANFFSAAEGRLDRWRTLHRVAKALAGAAERDVESLRQEAKKLLADMGPIEDFCAYPGPRLMAQLHERLQTGDWTGFARLVQRISSALMTNSYRDSTEAWKAEEEVEARPTDILPPSIGRGQNRKPYFEVLMVSPAERSMWPEIREVFRRLRRVEHPFVYEPVVVGSLEDAVLATVFNYNLQAVVISDGSDSNLNTACRLSVRSSRSRFSSERGRERRSLPKAIFNKITPAPAPKVSTNAANLASAYSALYSKSKKKKPGSKGSTLLRQALLANTLSKLRPKG